MSSALLDSLVYLIKSLPARLLFFCQLCPVHHFPIAFIFRVCSDLSYTSVGFNRLFGNSFKKLHYPEDYYCANVIRTIRICGVFNSDFEHNIIVNVVSSV